LYLVLAPAELPSADPGQDLEIKRIYLLGRYQGGGDGRRLIRQAVEFATGAGAWLLMSLISPMIGRRPLFISLIISVLHALIFGPLATAIHSDHDCLALAFIGITVLLPAICSAIALFFISTQRA
jgi:GNAT superfamily N-acetyltransferase